MNEILDDRRQGNIVETVSFAIRRMENRMLDAINEHERPSAVYRPTLMADGTKWCAIYGEDLQTGVVGFGDTPDKAMRAFDTAWLTERPPEAERCIIEAIAEEDREREISDNGQFGVGA